MSVNYTLSNLQNGLPRIVSNLTTYNMLTLDFVRQGMPYVEYSEPESSVSTFVHLIGLPFRIIDGGAII